MKETIERIATRICLVRWSKVDLIRILTEELSALNPMKIDEERMKKYFHHTYGDSNWANSGIKDLTDQYNSTIEDHQVLQPLPSEMPLEFNTVTTHPSHIIWQWVVQHYGTPTKKELVSVEELALELSKLDFGTSNLEALNNIAQHIIDTYSLNPPKREWWMDLKEGDRFIFRNLMGTQILTFSGDIKRGIHEWSIKSVEHIDYLMSSFCTPYIEPSIHDKFMASLSDEQKKMYEQMKEVKG